MVRAQSVLGDPWRHWQHILCKQRWVILAWVGWRHLVTLLRGRDDSIGKMLLKITMSHPLFNLRVRTLTVNSDDTCMGVPPLSMTSYRGYLPIKMLLYIAMTHAWAMKCLHITCNIHILLCFALRFYK